INRLICMRYLALGGHHPLAAADSRQALMMLSRGQHQPDVVVIDMNLGEDSGADLADQLRTADAGRWSAVPMVAMSADVSGTAHDDAKSVGMVSFLGKPFSAEELQAAVQEAVDQPHASNLACQAGRAQSPNAFDGRQLVDEAWLDQEIEDLGVPVLLELLNMFRSASASALKNMDRAWQRRDWDALADEAHKLHGSAANLGMRQAGIQARLVQEAAQAPLQDADQLATLLGTLTSVCHASADAVRTRLFVHAQQEVALATR